MHDLIVATPDLHNTSTPVVGLVRILGKRWLVALILFTSFTGLGIVWLAHQTPNYEIKAVVAEKKDSLASSATGLASLTGGLLGLTQQPSGVSTLQEAVYSAELADTLVTKYHLDREIFADRWDSTSKRWKPAKGVVPGIIDTIKSLFGVSTNHDVSSTDLQNYLREIVFVKSDFNSNNSAIMFYYPDRVAGCRILGVIMQEADTQVREQQRQQTDARLHYLYARLHQTEFPEQVVALTNLIQRLETQSAVINADRAYLTDLLSSPRASAQISRPRYPLVLGLIIITAVLLTLTFVWSAAVIWRR